MPGAGGALKGIAFMEAQTLGGLAPMTHENDDIQRLYAGLGEVRSRLTDLSDKVTREVTLAQERRPMLDRQLAELKALADRNGRELGEIKAMIRDVTTIARVTRYAGATIVIGGMGLVASMEGAWETVRSWFAEPRQ